MKTPPQTQAEHRAEGGQNDHEVSDRVVQFVMESGAYCAVSDDPETFYDHNEASPAPDEEAETKKRRRCLKKGRTSSSSAKTERLAFYTSPEMRQVLKNLMSLASSEMMSKGFKQL